MAEAPIWTEVLKTTIEERVPGIVETLARKRAYLKMVLSTRGSLVKNAHGQSHSWNARKKLLPLNYHETGHEHTFQRTTTTFMPTLYWRQAAVTDAIFEMDRRMNRGDRAVIKIWIDRQELIERSFRVGFGADLLTVDGQAAGNESKVWGLETMFQTAGVALADNLRVAPTGSYAGASIVRGAQGGATEADDAYECWSPTLIDYTGTGWTDATGAAIAAPNWQKTWKYAVRFGLTRIAANNEADEGGMPVVFVTEAMFRQAKDTMTDVYQVQRTDSATDLLNAGFDAFTWDGAQFVWDKDMPASVGYIVSFPNLQMMSMYDTLVNTRSFYREMDESYRMLLRFKGNQKFVSPRQFAKLYSWT